MAIWEFRQTGGNKKVLRLEDSAQPYGRPRKEPLFTEVIKVSIQTTKYPGSKNPPTRHGFGSGWEPMQLHGRWMTKHLAGKGTTANALADQWREFVRDEQPLVMSWGNIVSYECYIEQLELARESENEIAWKMTLLVDSRADAVQVSTTRPALDPVKDIDRFSTAISAMEPPQISGAAIDLFDTLESISSSLKQFTGIVVDIANAFSNIEKQSYSTIQSFRGVLANLRSGITTMRNTVLNATIDTAIVVRQAEQDLKWQQYQMTFDVESLVALEILNNLDRGLELQSRGVVSKGITALDGETWELITRRANIDVSRAGEVREMNGIRYGQLPVAGEFYLIPS